MLDLPSGLPESFSVPLSLGGRDSVVIFEKNEVFGENTRFLIADGQGALAEVDPGPDRSYLGRVAGRPGITASAVLAEAGLIATIATPGEESVVIMPDPDGTVGGAMHRISVVPAGVPGGCVHEGAPAAEDFSPGSGIAAMSGPITTTFAETPTFDAVAAAPGSTATQRPSRVVEVYEFEVGVEIGSRAFFASTAYNGNLATAQSVAQGIPGNLDARYLRGAGIKHRLGTVIIRTDANNDPLRDSVTATGGASNANSSLSAFRNYWNSNPGEVGNTHDLAVYHVLSNPSGLAYVNSVGTSSRYATCGGNGATSWANGTLVHEFGHSWSLGHVNESRGNFYESKPRNNNGSNSAGGQDVFVSVMHGGGSHNIGRLSTGEADQVYGVKNNKRNFGDLIANPPPIPPFGRRDDATSRSEPITIDVIANDHDGNNDILDVRLLDTVSQRGAAISLSQGTGPGGRNEIIYDPPSGTGTDFFHYTVFDTTGRTDWGAVYVTNIAPVVVDTTETQFNYDFGPTGGVVQTDWSEITPDSFGDISWSGAVGAVDRGTGSGVNNINRDFVTSSAPRTVSIAVQNGDWAVTINMGDKDGPRDQMRVSAEDGAVVRSNINSAANEYVYVTFDVAVFDGKIDIEFSDDGGSSASWALTRLSLRLERATGDVDDDNDGLLDDWERLHFDGSLTATDGLPGQDFDDDGLTDREEFIEGTDPTREDTDSDRLTDFDELFLYTTDPLVADSDGDGFPDGTEVLYRTDPRDDGSKPDIDGLVAYYPFDEGSGITARNFGSAGSAADATQNQGSVGWTAENQRVGGASLDLGGSSSLNAASPIPSSATAFTISVWVNPEADGGYKGIYAGRDSPGNWGINVENGHADVRFANTAGTSVGIDTPDNSVIASGGWYHVAETWTSNGSSTQGHVYLNGALVGSSTAGRPDFTQPTNGFFIGDDPCCGGREFQGQIDDLAVFTRALSGEEIAAAYAAGLEGGSIIDGLAPEFVVPTPGGLEINSVTGDVSFQFPTDTGVSYRIYRSTDLQNWSLLDVITGTGGLYPFVHDAGATSEPLQFYKVE